LSGDPVFMRRSGTGVRIELRAQPRACRSALECTRQGVLKAAVTAPAKTVSISGERALLAGRIDQWMRERAKGDG
jgi:hypothetical protein